MAEQKGSFQTRVSEWAQECFGDAEAADVPTRMARFLEEACEALQADGFPREWFEQLIERVYSREVGHLPQEFGGTMVTLAAWAQARGIDLDAAAEAELDRCWQNIERIRQKNASKPRFGPLPGEYRDDPVA